MKQKNADHIDMVAAHGTDLSEQIENRDAAIGIVGLGYVGLPLAYAFHAAGFPIIGFDVDQEKIDALAQGKQYLGHLPAELFRTLGASPAFTGTVNPLALANADFIVVCVPTPLGKHQEPDLSFVEATARQIGSILHPEQMVILESTTYPGTTDELVRTILDHTSGLVANRDYFLAYSPEREDPGNVDFDTSRIPKVVGADTHASRTIASALYETITDVVQVSTSRTAEAVKLVENIFRSVNIALVNELKTIFEKMDIDIFEVVDAAKTKPFGYMPFYPGPGLGGHCIPIDPFYLSWKAKEYGVSSDFIELAGKVNTAMPAYVVKRTVEALNHAGKSMKDAKVLCLGLAYKPNVDDTRESPAFAVMDGLVAMGALVDYYDPHVPAIPPTREHDQWTGRRSVAFDEDTIRSYDVIIIVTNHRAIDYHQLAQWAQCIVDTRGAMRGVPSHGTPVWAG